MARNRELRLAAGAAFNSELSAPLVRYSGVRVNTTVSSSSIGGELPPGARVIEVRVTDSVYLRFGSSNIGAAAADANSALVVAGEKIMIVPGVNAETPYTHFRAIRVGSSDVAMQIEKVDAE